MTEDRTVIIRQATADDVDALYTLIHEAMQVYALQSGITRPLDALCETKETLKNHIQKDHVLVAVREGQLIGTVRLVRHGVRTAYFSRFAVLPHLRQTGVGKKLYATAEQWLYQQHFDYVVLHTALSNETLVAFYQARGFHLMHTTFDRGYARGTFAKALSPHNKQT